MTNLERESLLVDLELNIKKAEHMAEKIINEYDLDSPKPDDLDDKVFAGNRYNIWMDMEILVDYIRAIQSGSNMLGEVL